MYIHVHIYIYIHMCVCLSLSLYEHLSMFIRLLMLYVYSLHMAVSCGSEATVGRPWNATLVHGVVLGATLILGASTSLSQLFWQGWLQKRCLRFGRASILAP